MLKQPFTPSPPHVFANRRVYQKQLQLLDELRLPAREGAGTLPGQISEPDLIEVAIGGAALRLR